MIQFTPCAMDGWPTSVSPGQTLLRWAGSLSLVIGPCPLVAWEGPAEEHFWFAC
jgi:hypothetical protein